MTRGASRAWSVLRIVYGSFFQANGLWILFVLTTGIGGPPIQPTASAAAFMAALSATGFMNQLLALSFVSGGVLLLFPRTAPAGLVILAPSATIILFFHLFLSGQWPVGLVVALIFSALAWHHRTSFGTLVHAGADVH